MLHCRSLILGLFFFLGSNSLLAADGSTQFGPDQLEFYLFQAFGASSQAQRFKLNHIGIAGETTEQGYLVSAVLQGYPAHNAGITRGDIIVTANGRPFHPVLSFNDSSLVPAGLTPHSLSFDLELHRGDRSISISLIPVFENLYDSYRNATLNSVQQFSSGNKIFGYIQLWAHSRSSDSLINLQQLLAGLDHCDGIIVDLRGSYGFLDQAHFQLFSLTTPDLAMSNAPEWLQGWTSPAYPVGIDTYRKPVALLIDSSTRAAGELLAMALDDSERIISLGSATAGMMGQFESVDATMVYTPAFDFVVDGVQIEGIGIEPEQRVDFPFSESRRDDPQFETAVSLLLGVI